MPETECTRTIPGTDITYFTRCSRPNYRNLPPAETDEGRESQPNYVPQHPATYQQENPAFLASPVLDMFQTVREAPNSPSPVEVVGRGGEAVGDVAQEAAEAAEDAWDVRGIIIPALVIGAFLWLSRPLLETGANLTEG